jgi:molybdopterin molybdotransferase
MLSVADALRMVCQHVRRCPATALPLSPALLGLVLAEDVPSDLDMPPYDKSMMDGYAVRSNDLASGTAVLTVLEEITAGMLPTKPVQAGQATRIMTGAPLPKGADAVVMVEKSSAAGTNRVRLQDHVSAGQNILPQGKEMRRGELILPAGTVLRPQELGLLATVGKNTVQVYRPPTVAVLSTGNEVVEPHLKPGPGQIRNSNATLLSGQVLRAKGELRYLGIALDTLESLRPMIRHGLQADLFLLSGGVSAGTLDLVPQVLQEEGVQPVFHKVAMKPGKPLYFGVKGPTLVFGLPGNPVSSFIGFELFVRPALRLLLGRQQAGPIQVQARLTTAHQHKSDRPTYHPCRWEARTDGWWVTPIPWFGSADLRALAQAQAFVVLPPGEQGYQTGDAVQVLAPELDL